MADEAVFHVTDGNFETEVLHSGIPVLVDFWATWCSPCRALAPVISEVAKEYEGRVKVAKMDVDSNPSTPTRYGIQTIPSLLFIKGGKVCEQMGYVSKETISETLDRLLP